MIGVSRPVRAGPLGRKGDPARRDFHRMTTRAAVRDLMTHYPRIFYACHLCHRRDPATGDELSPRQGSILDHLESVTGPGSGSSPITWA